MCIRDRHHIPRHEVICMLLCNHCYKHAKNLNNEHHHQHGCYQNQIHLRYKLGIEKLDVSVHQKVSFQLNGKNLTDKTYYPSTSGNATNTLIPVALGYGREFIFNTKVEF